ncbi:MAG: DUF2149 domain-containing protein [Anaerovoracaceae bacterium]|jgi:hypothetical protein
MIRRSGSKLIRGNGADEDVSPMEGTANIVDIMLVLAVGMMLALVMNYKVDLNPEASMRELENAETLSEDEVKEVESNKGLQEKGVVYMDPETGKYYIREGE